MTIKFFHQFVIGNEDELNQYGFRYPVVDSTKRILFAGCSFTFGAGVKCYQTFANQTAEKLGNEWSCLNIGIPGSGPNEQITAITWALNNFDIDKICWFMSDPMRTKVLFNNNRDIRITINNDTDDFEDLHKFVKHHLYFEKNYIRDLKNNIYTLFSLIKHKNIDCYVTCWIDSFDKELQDLKDEFNFKELGNIYWLDKGYDNIHPGPISHLDFANRIAESIKNDKQMDVRH